MPLADITNSNFVNNGRSPNKVIIHFGRVGKYSELIFIYDMLPTEEGVN